MKYKNVVILAVLLLIGCAGVEPARVENGLYINPEYQFSLSVPSGWKTSEELPTMFDTSKSIVSRQNFKATFTDMQNKSFILVSAEKTDLDWLTFKMYSDEFIRSLEDFYTREKKKFLKKPGTKYYHYEVYQSQIENCDRACTACEIEFQAGDLKASGRNIIYKSNQGILYTVALILIAREKQYETGLQLFNIVVDSFQRL